jgi:hypothetical protein
LTNIDDKTRYRHDGSLFNCHGHENYKNKGISKVCENKKKTMEKIGLNIIPNIKHEKTKNK